MALSCALKSQLEWPHRVLCRVACFAVAGKIMLKKPRVQGAIGLSRVRFVGLSLPLLSSSSQPRTCLMGTCVRNQSPAGPGGPGRHRPFQRDSQDTVRCRTRRPAVGSRPPHSPAPHPPRSAQPPAPWSHPAQLPRAAPCACPRLLSAVWRRPLCLDRGKTNAGGWGRVPLGLHFPHPTPGKELWWLGSGVPAPPCTCAPHTMPPQPGSMQVPQGVALPRQG